MTPFIKNLTLRNFITYLHIFSLWLLAISFAFRVGWGKHLFSTVVLISAGVTFIAEYIINRRWKEWKWTNNKWLWIAFIAYYLYLYIWQIASPLTPHFKFVMSERLPFVVCGILGLIGFSPQIKLKPIGIIFLLTSIFTSLWIILRGDGIDFFFLPLEQQRTTFMYYRIMWINSHMYYNIYLNVSLLMAFWLFREGHLSRWWKLLLLLSACWILYIIAISEGRVGFITALLLTAAMIILLLFRWYQKLLLPLIIMYIIGCIFIAQQHNRLDFDFVKLDPRWIIWNEQLDVIAQHPIIGNGVCEAKNQLIDNVLEYDNLRYRWGARPQRIQPHNAFLEAWGDFGIIGLATILFIFLFPVTMQPKKMRTYILLLIVIFAIQSMFDTFFGTLMYGIVLILFTSPGTTSQSMISQGIAEKKLDVV